MGPGRPIERSPPKPATLGDESDIASIRQILQKGRIEANIGPYHPEAVSPDDPHPVLLPCFNYLTFQTFPFLPCLPETGRKYYDPFDPGNPAFLYDTGNSAEGCDNDAKVNMFGNLRDIGITEQAKNRFYMGIYGKHFSPFRPGQVLKDYP